MSRCNCNELFDLVDRMLTAEEAYNLFLQDRRGAKLEAAEGSVALRAAQNFEAKWGCAVESRFIKDMGETTQAVRVWMGRNR